MKKDRTAFAVATSFQRYLTSVWSEGMDVAQAKIYYSKDKAESALEAARKRYPDAQLIEVVVGSDRDGNVTINGFPRSIALRKSSVKRAIWNKYGHKCAYCGADLTLRECHLDRYYPKNGDDPKNLMPACDACFCHKNGRTPGEFQAYLESEFARLRKTHLYRTARRYGMVRESPWTFHYLSQAAQNERNRIGGFPAPGPGKEGKEE